jgi:hypothetical protein
MPQAAPAPAPTALPAAPIGRRAVALTVAGPLLALAAYTTLSLVLEENYPFSHYPMYSNPSPERTFFVVADGDGEPIPVATLTGISCPKVGKMFRTKSDELAGSLGVRRRELDAGQLRAVAGAVFAQLREGAATRNQPMPEKLRLSIASVSYVDGQVVEDHELVAAE